MSEFLADYILEINPRPPIASRSYRGLYYQVIRSCQFFDIPPILEPLPKSATLTQKENYAIYRSLLEKKRNEHYKTRWEIVVNLARSSVQERAASI